MEHHYRRDHGNYRNVSIPKRVSAKVEPLLPVVLGPGISTFQSLKGFQPKWNLSRISAIGLMGHVSIPKRVSAKVEPGGATGGGAGGAFQSLKGFQPKWNLQSAGDR